MAEDKFGSDFLKSVYDEDQIYNDVSAYFGNMQDKILECYITLVDKKFTLHINNKKFDVDINDPTKLGKDIISTMMKGILNDKNM